MCRSAVRILMTKRPNILILNPDQRRGEVMSHLGNPAALTPNLDQAVAEDSVSFGKTFAQATVCTPSRCSFMTGWYPHTFGHRTMHHMLYGAEGDANLLRVLRRNGCFAWWGGKNDLIPGQDGRDRDCDVAFQA
jgi:arylsulfatase A-like enzyme